jgi:hypothetical protein
MTENFTFSYIFFMNVEYAVFRVDFLTYLTTMIFSIGLYFTMKLKRSNMCCEVCSPKFWHNFPILLPCGIQIEKFNAISSWKLSKLGTFTVSNEPLFLAISS